jgi:hypothetical protein
VHAVEQLEDQLVRVFLPAALELVSRGYLGEDLVELVQEVARLEVRRLAGLVLAG